MKPFSKERTVLAVNGPMTAEYPYAKNEFEPLHKLSQLTQNEPKIKMQNLKVNFLKENRGVNLADVGLGNLDSSLCFFQSSISHDVLCI